MSQATGERGGAPSFRMGFREFVGLVAMLMAINALGIDSMLPALPAIGDALDIGNDNQRQWIIAAYVFGFGSTQLIYGPLADRFGRKPILLISMMLFAATSVLAAFAWDFQSIIAARVLQGVCAAASRVLAISIVRDRYSGRQMARVMSLSFIVFLAVPILAPTIGQFILLFAPWQGIFLFLALFGIVLVGWAALRLPETLHPEDRRPISIAKISSAAKVVIGNRYSRGYTLASTMLFGALMGFITSVQQIFSDIFHEVDLFPLIFAGIAASMGVASYLNSRIVERLGTRLVSHTALVGFILCSAVHVAVAASGHETLLTFALLQAATMGCFGLAGSNFGSMAMEPVGHIAGTASSIQGFTSTVGGAALGILIGQHYDGTTLPMAAGYLVLGLVSLAIVAVTERGKLFRGHPVANETVS
ncbi:MFS transporter, DHA1 family, bicyclomycin/chloramphenicol resistance protein [Sphingomonas laterariae]|uniref:Bcr/CflA family efflux transporter n=1 Tax=Edaphosphingomonas laterariae TaxID=861865 RepID=A0A239ED05_9SPHN|nr:multidrug effflux MFS transporter [Sphingomonas laterariae]SNS42487.1 MFS transporter, DHA1 family, bicyclomycin/chloramphenicol resistance protein [Sphingomonas laterariae]